MNDKYIEWLNNIPCGTELHTELVSIKNDQDDINDRFYRDLAFGTGGLRGIIGVGTNRMNVFTVGRATAGLAEYIIGNGINKSVVIAYDSRKMSREFAECAANVLSSRGISVYIFAEITRHKRHFYDVYQCVGDDDQELYGAVRRYGRDAH